MKKTLATVACALAVVMALSVAPISKNHGFLGVDVVSAATEGSTTTTPTKPTTPSKPTTTPTKTSSTTTTGTSSTISRLLKYGSKGTDVKSLQTLLNSHGYSLKVDGVFGKLTLSAVKDYQKKNGLSVDGIVGPKTLAKLAPAAAPAAQTTAIRIGRAEYAAHGTKCFSVAVVAMAGDKIAAASVDDYQFTAASSSWVAVPNSDKDFGKSYPAGQILISKRTNTATYSANMAKSGGATQTWDASMAGVQKFAVGKTVAELESAIKANRNIDGTNMDPKVDAVTGATFTDTNGYLLAILSAAKDAAKQGVSAQIDAAQVANLKLGRAEYAAHGTKCFSVAVAATVEGKIIGASVDDYQFTAASASWVAVPNSDKDFGKNYPAGQILVSKRTNSAAYSAHMAEAGGATITWAANMDAVIKFADGKTAAELESAIKANKNLDGTNVDAKVDSVSGATFADTNGYLSSILMAAKDAK